MSLQTTTTTFLLFIIALLPLRAQVSSNMIKLGQWSDNANIVPRSGLYYNDIWGYVDGMGNEYAIIGSPQKVHFINVTNPTAPVFKQEFVGGSASIWRDFKTYGTYAYGSADEGTEGLLVFDLSALPSGNIVQLASLKGAAHFNRAHNIYIDIPNKRLYVAGSDTQNNGYIVYDLTNPAAPTKIASVALPGGYIHDIHVRNNIAYCSHGYNGMYIYNVTNATSPVFLDSYTASTGYNHSSWLTDDGNHLVFAEELPMGKPLIMLNVTDKTNISLTSSFIAPLLAPTYTAVTPHNPFIKGNYLYVAYYEDGTVVFDISNPAAPVRVAYYDTYPNNTNYNGTEGCWGTYPYLPSGNIISSDISTGLYVLKLDIQPPAPEPICLVDENFTNGQPSGWTFVDSWTFNSNNIGGQSQGANQGTGNWAYFDDDAQGANSDDVAIATSPTVDISNMVDVSLSFKYNYFEYNPSPQEFLRLRVWDGTQWQYWNGTTWTTTITSWLSTASQTGTFQQNIPVAFYNNAFKVELRYDDATGHEWGFGFDDFKICGTPTCQDDETIHDNPLASNTYQADSTIVSAAVIPSGNAVIFESAKITLTQGFHAQAGSEFTARIGGCPVNFNNPTTTEYYATAEASQKSSWDDDSKSLKMHISPNPVQHGSTLTVRYALPTDGVASLNLTDLSGRSIKNLIYKEQLLAGKHEATLNTNDLPMGVYLLNLRTREASVVQRVVIIH